MNNDANESLAELNNVYCDNMYFKRDGTECSIGEWAKLFGDPKYKIVKRTELPNGILISTVWLGLNHGFGRRKIIFETMVFRTDNFLMKWGDDLDMLRYETESQAIAGHDLTVKKWAVWYWWIYVLNDKLQSFWWRVKYRFLDMWRKFS